MLGERSVYLVYFSICKVVINFMDFMDDDLDVLEFLFENGCGFLWDWFWNYKYSDEVFYDLIGLICVVLEFRRCFEIDFLFVE